MSCGAVRSVEQRVASNDQVTIVAGQIHFVMHHTSKKVTEMLPSYGFPYKGQLVVKGFGKC